MENIEEAQELLYLEFQKEQSDLDEEQEALLRKKRDMEEQNRKDREELRKETQELEEYGRMWEYDEEFQKLHAIVHQYAGDLNAEIQKREREWEDEKYQLDKRRRDSEERYEYRRRELEQEER